MSYYRIKIQEKNNGQKTYTPQVGKLKISGLWIKKQEIVWHTIVHAHGNTFGLSETRTVGYATEDSALKVIDDYKNIQDSQARRRIISEINCFPQKYIPDLGKFDKVFITDSIIDSILQLLRIKLVSSAKEKPS